MEEYVNDPVLHVRVAYNLYYTENSFSIELVTKQSMGTLAKEKKNYKLKSQRTNLNNS